MDTRNSSGVERRRVPLDGNRPRTHPKHSGQMGTKARSPFAERDERLKDGDLPERLSYTLTGRRAGGRVAAQPMRIGGEP